MTGRAPFEPAPWAAGPHAQTIVGRLLRSGPRLPVERQRLTTPDDDFLDVDWGPDPSPEAPIALILHGLEGSSRRSYVASVARRLLLKGVRPVALNFRGCSGEPNRSLRFYHSGETGDTAWVLGEIRRRFPGRRLGAVGFSLGGNVLLKLLGERADGGAGLLEAAAAMSVPYDLAAGCDLLGRGGMGTFYSGYFLRSLRRKVRLKADRLAGVVDVEASLAASTIWAFDDHLTAPLNGFRDAAEYYERSSSARYLSGVAVPTLLVHAEDDPFLPSDAIPVAEARANPSLDLRLTARGGHVGFLRGTPWRPAFWADDGVASFLANHLGATPGTAGA